MTKSLISHMFTDEDKPSFDFCMCNPPFYSNVQELCESRSPARYSLIKCGFTINKIINKINIIKIISY